MDVVVLHCKNVELVRMVVLFVLVVVAFTVSMAVRVIVSFLRG